MTRTIALALLLASLGLGHAAPLAAQAATSAPASASSAPASTPAGTPWSALSDADRAALIEPTRERWERATPEQQRRYLERARFWAGLTPEQKRMARAGAERWRDSNGRQRGRLREVWQRFQALPPAERETARRTWESLDARQRRAWLEAGGPGVAPPPTDEPKR
ncbi:MAG: DUF3106 domain-containing protein [Silanimonas sp.]